MRTTHLAALLCLPGLCAPLSAQFWSELANPKVKVTIMHPPGLGLKVERVAFAPARDLNSRELVDALSADLVQGRAVEVVDRTHLDTILAEQGLGQSGYLQPETIARLGKLLGPTALVVVNVDRRDFSRSQSATAENYRDMSKHEDRTRTKYQVKNTLDYAATVQVVDLTTGRIFGAERFAESPSLEAESYEAYPAYPRDAEVAQRAFDAIRVKVSHLLVTWAEARDLVFFDDETFGMDKAHALLKAKNVEGALDAALKSLDESEKNPGQKPKYYPRAYYNVGIIHFIRGDYAAALPFLQKALDMQPDASIYQGARKECDEAMRLQDQLRALAKPAASLDAGVSAPAKTSAPAKADSAEARLQRLQELYKKGLLTKAEYEQKRQEILKDL